MIIFGSSLLPHPPRMPLKLNVAHFPTLARRNWYVTPKIKCYNTFPLLGMCGPNGYGF